MPTKKSIFVFRYYSNCSCDGVNTWGSYSLTLIDSLDTLAVMGNFTEFRRVVDILLEKSNFDSDINVSVFETNIRIVGGLLGAHLLQHRYLDWSWIPTTTGEWSKKIIWIYLMRRSGAKLEPGWPCNGPLLRMAEDVVNFDKRFHGKPILILIFLAGKTIAAGIRYTNRNALWNRQSEIWCSTKWN